MKQIFLWIVVILGLAGLLTLATGKKTVIKRPKMVCVEICKWCDGRGWTAYLGKCLACNGKGGKWKRKMIVVEEREETQ